MRSMRWTAIRAWPDDDRALSSRQDQSKQENQDMQPVEDGGGDGLEDEALAALLVGRGDTGAASSSRFLHFSGEHPQWSGSHLPPTLRQEHRTVMHMLRHSHCARDGADGLAAEAAPLPVAGTRVMLPSAMPPELSAVRRFVHLAGSQPHESWHELPRLRHEHSAFLQPPPQSHFADITSTLLV